MNTTFAKRVGKFFCLLFEHGKPTKNNEKCNYDVEVFSKDGYDAFFEREAASLDEYLSELAKRAHVTVKWVNRESPLTTAEDHYLYENERGELFTSFTRKPLPYYSEGSVLIRWWDFNERKILDPLCELDDIMLPRGAKSKLCIVEGSLGDPSRTILGDVTGKEFVLMSEWRRHVIEGLEGDGVIDVAIVEKLL